MRPRLFVAFIGFAMIISGTFCPLLRPFHLINWDIYALNKPYGIVVFVVAATGILAVITGQKSAAKAIAWLSLLLVILIYIAAVLKVNTSFSFIPFKNISAGLSRLIKFKYGWVILFFGSLLALVGSYGANRKVGYKPAKSRV